MTTLALRLAPPRSQATAHTLFHVGCAVAGCLLIAGLAQPVFAPTDGRHDTGPDAAASATGGYLLGFVVAAQLPAAWRLMRRFGPRED